MKTFRPPVLKKDNGIARCMVDGNVWIRGLDVAVARLTKKPNYASAATCLFANQLPGYDARVIRSLKDTGWYFDEKHLPDFVAFLSDDEKVAEAVKITHAGIAKSKAKKAAREAEEAAKAAAALAIPEAAPIITEETPAVIGASIAVETPPADSEKDKIARLLLGLKANNSELAKLRGDFEALLKAHQSLQQLFASYKAESSARIARLEHERKVFQTPHPRRRLFAYL